jgi:uncharacterized membrane protein
MAIGPVQLLVLGFDDPKITGGIVDELDRLRDSDTVRVIDSLTVFKDAQGDVLTMQASNLTDEESQEFGAYVGALIGLGAAGAEGAVVGAALGADAASDGVDVFDDDDVWDVVDELPNNSAAAVILLEHRWAIPLRDAIINAGGFPLGNSFISPADLVAIGLMSAAEAEGLADDYA